MTSTSQDRAEAVRRIDRSTVCACERHSKPQPIKFRTSFMFSCVDPLQCSREAAQQALIASTQVLLQVAAIWKRRTQHAHADHAVVAGEVAVFDIAQPAGEWVIIVEGSVDVGFGELLAARERGTQQVLLVVEMLVDHRLAATRSTGNCGSGRSVEPESPEFRDRRVADRLLAFVARHPF